MFFIPPLLGIRSDQNIGHKIHPRYYFYFHLGKGHLPFPSCLSRYKRAHFFSIDFPQFRYLQFRSPLSYTQDSRTRPNHIFLKNETFTLCWNKCKHCFIVHISPPEPDLQQHSCLATLESVETVLVEQQQAIPCPYLLMLCVSVFFLDATDGVVDAKPDSCVVRKSTTKSTSFSTSSPVPIPYFFNWLAPDLRIFKVQTGPFCSSTIGITPHLQCFTSLDSTQLYKSNQAPMLK